jgi:hypothetical protein
MDDNIMPHCWYEADLFRLACSPVEYSAFILALMNDRNTTLSLSLTASQQTSKHLLASSGQVRQILAFVNWVDQLEDGCSLSQVALSSAAGWNRNELDYRLHPAPVCNILHHVAFHSPSQLSASDEEVSRANVSAPTSSSSTTHPTTPPTMVLVDEWIEEDGFALVIVLVDASANQLSTTGSSQEAGYQLFCLY